MNNRITIIFGVVITLLLIRLDIKNEMLNDRVDQIENIIIRANHGINYTKNDIECLARNIYYEAGTEADVGKYAVAHVTVNRVKSNYWGNTVCKVVYARAQFSWTLKKHLPKPDTDLYARCREIAVATLKGRGVKGLDRSLFYHATYIKDPKWVDPRHEAGQVGTHIFYNRARGSNLYI